MNSQKRNIRIASCLIAIAFLVSTSSNAQELSLKLQTVCSTGSSSTRSVNNQSITLQQSIGQGSPIGTISNRTSELRQGFIQPSKIIYQADLTTETPLQVQVFPNPFDEKINIRIEDDIEGSIQAVVYDLSGRVVFSEIYNEAQEFTIMLNDISSGAYLIHLQIGNQKFITQIQKF